MNIVQPLLPLFICVNDEIVCNNKQKIIDELKTGKKNLDDKNENDYGTFYEEHTLSDTGSAKDLLNTIKEMAASVANFPNHLEIELEDVWGKIQEKNMSMSYHTHYDINNPNRIGFSFVYYLQAIEGQGMLQLVVEHGFRNYSHLIKPKTGLLVLFPINTPHFTLRNNMERERIAISGNLILKEKK